MKTKHLFGRIVASPLLWGGLLSFGFYAALLNGVIDHPLVLRYFAGHEVEYITTVMFFVGFAALALKYVRVRAERKKLRHSPVLEPQPGHKVDSRHAGRFLEELHLHEKENGRSILTWRLRQALQFVRRSGSASELDTELRYLSEEDAAKADADYGLVRLILWAVPMLGFLGTVIGITIALGNLDLNAINESSKMLSGGLMVAFDTTALAIALDVALYFVQFLVYREESNLLWEVDKRTDAELRGRFETEIASEDNSHVVALRRMFEDMSRSLEQLMIRQTKIWEQSMTAANQRFSQLTEQNVEILKISLTAALNENLSQHAKTLTEAEAKLLERSRETTIRFCDALQKNAAGLQAIQEATVQQTETVQNVLGTSGQLIKLEERLNHNLASLAQVGNFEETVNSLAAVIHLLNGKHRFTEYRPVSNDDVNNEKGSAA